MHSFFVALKDSGRGTPSVACAGEGESSCTACGMVEVSGKPASLHAFEVQETIDSCFRAATSSLACLS
jgi:hypothetical protein